MLTKNPFSVLLFLSARLLLPIVAPKNPTKMWSYGFSSYHIKQQISNGSSALTMWEGNFWCHWVFSLWWHKIFVLVFGSCEYRCWRNMYDIFLRNIYSRLVYVSITWPPISVTFIQDLNGDTKTSHWMKMPSICCNISWNLATWLIQKPARFLPFHAQSFVWKDEPVIAMLEYWHSTQTSLLTIFHK